MPPGYEKLVEMAALPIEGHDAEWLEFCESHKIPGCYLPALQAVLAQGRWRRMCRRGDNPAGYVVTATHREAVKMGLGVSKYTGDAIIVSSDRADGHSLPGVATKRGLAPLPLRGRPYNVALEEMDTGRFVKKGNGGMRYEGYHDDGIWSCRDLIPLWLSKGAEDEINGERDAVDWDRVARYAVFKPHMAPHVATALQLRAQGIPRDLIRDNRVLAAWRWIDRNWHDRIVPLFQMEEPPTKEPPAKKPAPRPQFIPPAAALSRNRSFRQEVKSPFDEFRLSERY